MKNRKRILFMAGLCMYCVAAITAIWGDGQASKNEKNSWQAASVPVVLPETVQAYAGPGVRYDAQGSLGQPGDEATALSAAYDEQSRSWWVQTELTDRNEKKRVYTEADGLAVDPGDLPEEKLQRSDVVVNRTVYAYWGPGYDYAMYRDPVPPGAEGRVWQTDDGYAQLELEDENGGLRRVWVQENALEAPNG